MARGITLRSALVLLLALSIVPTAVGIGVISYLNASASANLLWGRLANEIADVASEKTLRYVEAGRSQLLLHRRLTNAGRLDPADRETTLSFLQECVQAQYSVTWCSYAGSDGVYLAAYKEPPNDAIRITWREVTPEGTRYRDYYANPDGSWRPIWDKLGDYDPRSRPWWKIAQSATTPTWAPPVLFSSRKQPGVLLTLRQDGPDGSMIGSWQMEYELSYLARFLSSMVDEFEQGGLRGVKAYLVTRDGVVVGHPRATDEQEVGWTTAEVDGKLALASAVGHRDQLLTDTYAITAKADGPRRFELTSGGRDYLAVYEPFPAESGLPWGAIVVAPVSSILGPVYDNNRNTAIIATVFAAIAILIGVYLTGRLTRRLRTISQELERIGRLELEAGGDDDERGSRVHEIAQMFEARDRMKGGLRSFSKYVPAALVRELMEKGQEAALGGEVQELTIYFSDVADFTTISEQLGPARLVDALGEYLAEMSRLVTAHRGTLDKYIGDAIMAFWGAPKPVENHAAAACRTALACQQQLARMRDVWRAEDHPLFHARIGINTGPTLVGNIGADYRMNYTVMGDSVNVASRLEGLCKTYGVPIMIGERTAELVGDELVLRPLDRVAVKGKEQGLLVYELCGERAETEADTVRFADACGAALDAYFERRFDDAVHLFDAALGMRPADVAARLLRDRAAGYTAHPPGPGWSGVFTLQHK